MASMRVRPYTWFCSRVLFPLHERLKGHDTVAVLRSLESTQWLPQQQLEQLRITRLRELLEYAGRQVPYYRDLFNRIGFDPASVASVADLQALPILRKPEMRAAGDRMVAEGARKLVRLSTTGSTGDPLRFYLSRRRIAHDVATRWRATRWWGVDIGDREFVAWSSPIELTRQDRMRQLRDRVFRTTLVPSIALSPQRLDAILDILRRLRPTMLYGYPSALSLIAQRALDQNVELSDLGVRIAFTTAEKLYPHQRDAIGAAFGCPVADAYGGRDAGFIAHECPAGGLHITAEDIIVETVDETGRPAPPGQPGEVLITHLFSHEYPFIRYANGDVAVLADRRCGCGRGLPLLEAVMGRTNDFLLAEDGSKVHDVAFAMHLRDMPGVLQFKIIQESMALTRLQLVTGNEFDPARATSVLNEVFRRYLGPGVTLQIEHVRAIEPEASGKYRYVVSRLATDPRGAQPLPGSGRQSNLR
jgi:phenylacetate-CoA ligase